MLSLRNKYSCKKSEEGIICEITSVRFLDKEVSLDSIVFIRNFDNIYVRIDGSIRLKITIIWIVYGKC